MVFERQSRQKGVGALPRNALQSPTASGATAGATATASPPSQQNRSTAPQSQPQPSQQQQQQQLPPKSSTSLLAGNAVASLGLRSLLGSARASSIFLDNDSLILPSEHGGDDDEEYDDRISESCDSSLNLSLNTVGGGGGYGMGSAASIGGGSVLTVANTVTSDPTMTAMMVAAELPHGAGRGDANMTTPQQVTAAPATKSAVVRSWMTKTATITRSINNNNTNYIASPPSSSTSYYANNNKVPMTMDALSQAATPAASGSRPPPPNATPATAAASSLGPTPPAANAATNDQDLKIVATASMITLDSTSPSAISTKSNMLVSSTITPGKNGTKTTAATGLLLAPPSPLAEDDSCIHRDQEEDGLPTITYYNSSKNNNRPMSTFCQYGPRWLKFLLIISIVFLLASVALVAVGVSMQYMDLTVANSNSPDGATSSAVSTPVGGVDVVASEERNGGPAEPFLSTTGDDNNNNIANAGDNDETFDLSNAIATEENKEEEEILASSPSVSPLEEDNGAINESNSTANTTETTFAPTQTDAPSDQPSAMPSSIPSPFPTIAPSDSPSTAPTNLPSTLFPTSLPTVTMQPSSLQPALAAPEIHLPTVSDMPSILPTTTSEEQFFDIVTFYVLAGQWDENQSEMTRRGASWLLENLPIQQQDSNRSAATSAFMVHLGDWNGPVGVEADREYQLAASRAEADDDDDDDEVLPLPPPLDCSEQEFIQTHIDFSTCSVPVYFTLGSREFGDCPDPAGALSNYRTWLQDYDLRYWDYPPWAVWNDGSSGNQENWIFNYNDIVFTAINLARAAISRDTTPSSIVDDTEWANRYETTLDWVNMNYYDFRRNNRVFCIFANSGPEDETNREFYDELLSRIEFRWIRMHFVIVHRNLPSVDRNLPRDEELKEAYSRRYNGIRNLDVISVQASVWPPMKVEIDLSNIIRAEVSVDQSTWFDEYVEAESL